MSKECWFELWDLDSGNALGSYDTEDEALELVRVAITEDGPEAVADWALAHNDRAGHMTSVAEGRALAERAARPTHA